MLLAFKEAEKAKLKGTFPIGAVLVDSNGEVVGSEHNKVFSDCDITAHAELVLIRNASDKLLDLDNKRFVKHDFTLYSTCEPFPMCTGALLLSNIKRVVWAANDAGAGAMRIIGKNNCLANWFEGVTYEAAPYSDLEIRQGIMMAEFYTTRGYLNTHWQQQYMKDI